jgi:hypothetical protein
MNIDRSVRHPVRLVAAALALAALACSTVSGPGATLRPTATAPRATRAATAEVEATEPEADAEASATPRAEAESTATDEPTPEPVEGYLGDVVEQDGLALTALQIEDPATPGSLYQPADGKRLVAVEVVLGNVDQERFAASPTYLTLLDSEGFTYPFAVAAQDALALASVTLRPGEQVRGWAAFEVPAEAELAALRFSPSGTGDPFQTNLTPRPDDVEPLLGTPRTAPDLPPLGAEVADGGYTLTALQLEDPASAGLLYTPVAGKHLVAVEVVLGNPSGAPVTLSPLFAYLVDSDGYVYPGRLFGRDGGIEPVTLQAGDKAQGWLSFELPDGALPAGVRYTFDLFSGLSLLAGLGAP